MFVSNFEVAYRLTDLNVSTVFRHRTIYSRGDYYFAFDFAVCNFSVDAAAAKAHWIYAVS